MDSGVIISEDINCLFQRITGMNKARESLQILDNSINTENERIANGLETYDDNLVVKTVNFGIAGNRGTGKSKLSDIISKFCYERGLTADMQVVRLLARNIKKIEDITTVKEYSKKTVIVENIEDFIFNEDLKTSFKIEVLNAIEDMMKKNLKDWCFIITGTKEAFEKIQLLNRTVLDYLFDVIELPNYSTDELIKIIYSLAWEDKFHIKEDCAVYLRQKFDAERKLTDFMNIINLQRVLKEAKKNLVTRCENKADEIDDMNEKERIAMYTTFIEEDFQQNYDGKSLEELCEELDGLTGLERVKQAVKEQITSIQVGIKAAKAGAGLKNQSGTLHMVFEGNPGTGKTTVANIVGKIYAAMGALPNTSSDMIHVVSRADLVSQYIGGTAQMVKEACRKADGGVFFIDEAYSLVNSDQDSYGKEAVDTLIQEMENRRDTMMVILAGYKEPMKEFLKANPGFRSRIPTFIEFEDYTEEELYKIFEYMLANGGEKSGSGYFFEDDTAAEKARVMIEMQSKVPDFGNARGVRNLLEKIIMKQRSRVVSEITAGVVYEDKKLFTMITKADVNGVHNNG